MFDEVEFCRMQHQRLARFPFSCQKTFEPITLSQFRLFAEQGVVACYHHLHFALHLPLAARFELF